jgi:hypothetical protein
MKGNEAYLRLDNGIYVRRDSTLVDRAGLAREYRQGGE